MGQCLTRVITLDGPHPLVQQVINHAEKYPTSLAVVDNHGKENVSNGLRNCDYNSLIKLVKDMSNMIKPLLPLGNLGPGSMSSVGIGSKEITPSPSPYRNKKNPHVAFLTNSSLEYVITELSLWSLGCVAVPLSVHSPPAELVYFLLNAEVDLLICDKTFESKLSEARSMMVNEVDKVTATAREKENMPKMIRVETDFESKWDLEIETVVNIWKVNIQKLVTSDSGPNSESDTVSKENITNKDSVYQFPLNISSDSNSLILYTSGTTGRPKGVVHTVDSVTSQLISLTTAWKWTNTDRTLHVLPLHHIHGLQNVLNCCLYAGGCCEFFGHPKSKSFSGEECVARLVSGDITCFHAVPTIYTKILQYLDSKYPDKRQSQLNSTLISSIKSKMHKHLRLMVCGSAALPVPTMEKWARVSGHPLLERYGMTEIGMALSNKYK